MAAPRSSSRPLTAEELAIQQVQTSGGDGTGSTSGGAGRLQPAPEPEDMLARREKATGVHSGLEKLQHLLARFRKFVDQFATVASIVCMAGIVIGGLIAFFISPIFTVLPATGLMLSIVLFWSNSYIKQIMIFVDAALEVLSWNSTQTVEPDEKVMKKFRRSFGSKTYAKLKALIAYDVDNTSWTVEKRVRTLVLQIVEHSVMGSIRAMARMPALSVAVVAAGCMIGSYVIQAYWPDQAPPAAIARPTEAVNGEGGLLGAVGTLAVDAAMHTPGVGQVASAAGKVIKSVADGNMKARSFIAPATLEYFAKYLAGIAVGLWAAAELIMYLVSASLRKWINVRQEDELKKA